MGINIRRAGRALATGAVASAALLASVASAQTQTSETTFVILGAPPGATGAGEERTALPGQPLLTQSMTATRAARLDQAAPSMSGIGAQRSFTAGTLMFGVLAPDGWIYCAVAESINSSIFRDNLACYQDGDNDGKFEIARNSGGPFEGVSLFVFQPGPPKPLAAPIAYSIIPYKDGPKSSFAVTWKPTGKVKKDVPVTPNAITLQTGALVGEDQRNVGLFPEVSGVLADGPITYQQLGARITVLGATPEGGLRYRVDKTFPQQVVPMQMTLKTSTYIYVVRY